MNVLLFVLEILVVLTGIALVPMRSELRPCRPLGIDDDITRKKSRAVVQFVGLVSAVSDRADTLRSVRARSDK
jgi:hypothetical protein